MKHRAFQLRSLPWQAKPRLIFVSLVLTWAFLALSGCTLVDEHPQTDDSVGSAAEPTEENDPAVKADSTSESVSEDLDAYSVEDEQLIYYGEVLAYRYGISVSPEEWLSVAKQECDSYSEAGSTRVHGPAAAKSLDEDPRSGLLVESFVFMVIGSYWCGIDESTEKIERYGSEAQLISLAFMATVIDNESINLSVADFSNYYDNQLFIAQQEFDAPAGPDYSVPQEPDASDPYGSSDALEDEAPGYSDSDPDYPGSDPYDEYKGNSGGPTLCNDGTVSQSSGQGTCSWHGGEY